MKVDKIAAVVDTHTHTPGRDWEKNVPREQHVSKIVGRISMSL